MVGDGSKRASLEASLPEAIFCGQQSGEALACHYASGDVFLFPSLTETYGNVTPEALASGLAVLDRLVAQGVDQPVIMLTGHGTVEMCRRAFKAGAAEFLEKPVDDELLIEALQASVRQHVRSRERHQADQQARERHAQLSAREREVLALVADGLSNREILRRYIWPKYHICEKTFYNIINASADPRIIQRQKEMRSSQLLDGKVWDGSDPARYADAFKVKA